MKKYILLVIFMISSLAEAVELKDTKINYLGMYGDGRIFAALDKSISLPGCENSTWIVIANTHSHKKELYSMLLAAHAAGKNIDINSTTCFDDQAVTITENTNDYLLVK